MYNLTYTPKIPTTMNVKNDVQTKTEPVSTVTSPICPPKNDKPKQGEKRTIVIPP